jgi:hypothetical protein
VNYWLGSWGDSGTVCAVGRLSKGNVPAKITNPGFPIIQRQRRQKVDVYSGNSSSSSSSSSSSCVAGGISPGALQPYEAYCAKPHFISTVHLQRLSTSEGVKDLY